ncbi:hypothetical protein GCK72_019118 [Caenorhabditis remanei]|uniref:Cysteine dioxygenase n=1 Tax=Caenorhabditis remanei TaxID=31234 RepID=A0A6A5GD12_CAERE|nr:hypothetical protein GCK72_019123 [Caenorhabditis remanei]XP_053581797.1 hypothetical protein GCK72_019118 [Caenorhabditis remanei]KAF1752563.1 hypothetical protein GCK72_019118 [Caenorhabditis remanei]KAF1752568.1 hypothetical protein GCK72_019123 [Caenorhabditis remanei]
MYAWNYASESQVTERMENPTRVLQMMIRRIAMLSKRFDGSPESVSIIHSVVANFDSNVLQQFLPNRFSRAVNTMFESTIKDSSGGIQYADVYKDEYCHVNTFGLSRPGLKIPLHDHPDQNAVMKVFQGSVKIRSFTILDEKSAGSEEKEVSTSRQEIDQIRVRYEGETVLSSRSGEIHSAVLGPKNGNIHEVVALEPHTYFCDFFFPVTPSCHYYVPVQLEPLVAGQTLVLQQIPCPRSFICDNMDFPSFQKFNISD